MTETERETVQRAIDALRVGDLLGAQRLLESLADDEQPGDAADHRAASATRYAGQS